MPRFHIKDGILTQSWSPADLPGSFILKWHRVFDLEGGMPSEDIQWDGTGHWMNSSSDYPKHQRLWLGSENSSRPHVVYVELKPTKESNEYEAGYRKGYKAVRKTGFPEGKSDEYYSGLRQGYADRSPERVKEMAHQAKLDKLFKNPAKKKSAQPKYALFTSGPRGSKLVGHYATLAEAKAPAGRFKDGGKRVWIRKGDSWSSGGWVISKLS